MEQRFDRNIRFFGSEGQERLRQATVALVGIGGLGTHVVQQLALLGVGELVLVDHEQVSESNRNRYIGLRHDDPIPGTWKVDLGKRMALSIDPGIRVTKIRKSAVSKEAMIAFTESDYVFGCVDCEGTRLFLTETCARLALPYVDASTELIPEEKLRYGGRVCIAWDGSGCLVCLGILDGEEAQLALAGEVARDHRARIYGVDRDVLDTSGPSIVSLNGAIASLAVTELMVAVTGLRPVNRVLTYRGNLGGVTVSTDLPAADCYFCKGIWGDRDLAALERFLGAGIADEHE